MTAMPRLSPDTPFLHPDVQAVNCTFGAFVEIGQGSRLQNTTFEDYAYCDRLADIANTTVGRFSNIAALTRMMAHWGHDPMSADVRARTIYLVQIGYISMQSSEDIETRLSRIPSYVQIYTGAAPEPREIARFNARLRRDGAA